MKEITSGVTTAAIGLPTRSASALLGPYDSPAGLNQIRLKNALNHHFHQAFLVMAGETYNLTQRVADAILIDFSLSPTADVLARFPDGSRVTVQINR